MPKKVHEISGILAVMNRKDRIEPNLIGIDAQQPGTDRMNLNAAVDLLLGVGFGGNGGDEEHYRGASGSPEG
jgi:hypothetical protein